MEITNKLDNKNPIMGMYFMAEAAGEGIVNFDDSQMQKDFMTRHKINHGDVIFSNYKNFKFAKKSFYREKVNGKDVFKFHLKISHQCMRKNILKNYKYRQLDWHKKDCLLKRITNPNQYLRGYMATSDKWNFNKTTCVYISPAIDTNAVITPEKFTNSNEKSTTALYVIDTASKTNYKFHGDFDVKEAQFLCLDPQGRPGLPLTGICESDNNDTALAQAYIQNFGKKPYTFGNYVLAGEFFNRYQVGLLYSDEYLTYLLRTFITDLIEFKIKTPNGYCKLSSLEVHIQYKDGSEYVCSDISKIKDDLKQTLTFHKYYEKAEEDDVKMFDVDDIADEESTQNNTKKSNSRKSNSTK